MTAEQKITPAHLKRAAYLYVRQSTLRQVLENTESTQRQYALRKRAMSLGWPEESIVTIDCDLGQSGASVVGREGFKHLVAEVGLGKAGIVLGLEVSRLAHNCADWHRLLEICALTGHGRQVSGPLSFKIDFFGFLRRSKKAFLSSRSHSNSSPFSI